MNDGEGKSCATCRSWERSLPPHMSAFCCSPVVCVDWNQWQPKGTPTEPVMSAPEGAPTPLSYESALLEYRRVRALEHGHYFKDVSHLKKLDIYRVLDLFGVTDPCLGHAIKKLLVAGGRGAKDVAMDVKEAADSLERWAVMQEENRRAENE